MKLPDIEVVSAAVHAAWMVTKQEQGVTSRLAEDGEELMAPYAVLSEKAKDLDRGTVRTVYAAIEQAASAPDWVATAAEADAARKLHCDDSDGSREIDEPAAVSRCDEENGLWVQGWMWISKDDLA